MHSYSPKDQKQSRILNSDSRTSQKGKKNPDVFKQTNENHCLQYSYPSKNIAQCVLYGSPENAIDLISNQKKLQNETEEKIAEFTKEENPDSDGAYTTVGFEHEFAMHFNNDKFNPLNDLTHVELAESEQKLGFTNLPFKLETDFGNTIELVSAPFIIATPKEYPIPIPKDVEEADNLIKNALNKVIEAGKSFRNLATSLEKHMGLVFKYKKEFPIESYNMGVDSMGLSDKPKTKDNKIIINFEDLDDIVIKDRAGRISTQVNFATDAFVYDAAKSIDINPNLDAKEYRDKESKYINCITQITTEKKMQPSANLLIFLRELAKNLSMQSAIAPQKELNVLKEKIFNNTLFNKELVGIQPKVSSSSESKSSDLSLTIEKLKKVSPTENPKERFDKLRREASFVKDINPFWLKDTLYNFGLGILNENEWIQVLNICQEIKEKNKEEPSVCQALEILSAKIYPNESLVPEKTKISFGEHDPNYLGARQDTYISLADSKCAPHFKDKTFHLVEMRVGDNIEDNFKKIKEQYIEHSTETYSKEILNLKHKLKKIGHIPGKPSDNKSPLWQWWINEEIETCDKKIDYYNKIISNFKSNEQSPLKKESEDIYRIIRSIEQNIKSYDTYEEQIEDKLIIAKKIIYLFEREVMLITTKY